jgi:hypothetical protein
LGSDNWEALLPKVITAVGRILKEIEARADSRTIDLGLMLLRLSERAVTQISKGIEVIASKARQDGERHDFTVGLGEAGTGLTVHCNDEPIFLASQRLHSHCELRKYTQKANSWFGICLAPSDTSVRLGINLDYDWEQSAKMDALTRNLPKTGNFATGTGSAGRKSKVWRNDPCPCGSGRKYKKCCPK